MFFGLYFCAVTCPLSYIQSLYSRFVHVILAVYARGHVMGGGYSKILRSQNVTQYSGTRQKIRFKKKKDTRTNVRAIRKT